MITWDEKMSTGLRDLDVQHKTIIQKFNQLSEALNKPEMMETAADVLDFLQFYAVWHFEREESCMEQYNCPVAQANKKSHAYFVEKFNAFFNQWQQGTMDADLARSTYQELENWIIDHILGIDTSLKSCVGIHSQNGQSAN